MIKEDYNKTTNDIYSGPLFYTDWHKDVFSGLVLNYADAYAVSIIVDLMKDVSGMIVFASLLTYIGIKVDLTGVTSNSTMATIVGRIDDAISLSRQQDNLASVPKSFVDSFIDQLLGQDWRLSLDPFPSD